MGYPTAVADRLELEFQELKDYLEITTSAYDAKLELAIPAAKQLADKYCGSWFTDDGLETGTAVDIPDPVKVGVMLMCKRILLAREPGLKWDAVSSSRVKRWADDPKVIEDEVHGYWWHYREPVGF